MMLWSMFVVFFFLLINFYFFQEHLYIHTNTLHQGLSTSHIVHQQIYILSFLITGNSEDCHVSHYPNVVPQITIKGTKFKGHIVCALINLEIQKNAKY